MPPPDGLRAPFCPCGVPAVWQRNFWWCHTQSTIAGARGCGFTQPDGARTGVLLPRAEVEAEMARRTAALLTASALGPLEELTFIGETVGCGRGLFARQASEVVWS